MVVVVCRIGSLYHRRDIEHRSRGHDYRPAGRVHGSKSIGNAERLGGGQADGQLLPFSEIFDGTQWTRAPGMPTPRDHLAAVTVDHFVYAIGGRAIGAGPYRVSQPLLRTRPRV